MKPDEARRCFEAIDADSVGHITEAHSFGFPWRFWEEFVYFRAEDLIGVQACRIWGVYLRVYIGLEASVRVHRLLGLWGVAGHNLTLLLLRSFFCLGLSHGFAG